MDGLQIVEPNVLAPITKKETFDSVDSVKVKITKAMFLNEDLLTFLGDQHAIYPVIPGRIAVGKVVETLGENNFGLERGTDVFLHSVTNCNKCFECAKGDYEHCASFNVAGKNTDGFLRDFAVVNCDALSTLPPSVHEDSALFIDHIALCDKVIDSISVQKGEHVVIVGGDILGIILAQLVIYYQGVPILVDVNQENLELAKQCGVYYTIFSDNKVEKNVSDLTGARLSKKVVYMTGSNINADIALKLAGQNGTVCFAGFGTPNIRVNFNTALLKQLNFTCVTNGFSNVNSAINLLVTKAVNTENFKLKTIKNESSKASIEQMAKKPEFGALDNTLIIDMS